MPESTDSDLVILHDKHHDTASLGALLDLVLDGGPAEGEEVIIFGLWQREPTTLLRVAAGSKQRLGNLEDMVQMEGDDVKVRNLLPLQAVLDRSRRSIEAGKGLSREAFWQAVEERTGEREPDHNT